MDINRDLGCSRATDSDVALDSSTGLVIMASGGRASYSHQTVPLHPRVSGSTSLHNAQTVLLLFLSHLCDKYLHIVVALSVDRPSSLLVSSAYPSLMVGQGAGLWVSSSFVFVYLFDCLFV